MIVDIRCPKCDKLVAKKEEKASSKNIYFYSAVSLEGEPCAQPRAVAFTALLNWDL